MKRPSLTKETESPPYAYASLEPHPTRNGSIDSLTTCAVSNFENFAFGPSDAPTSSVERMTPNGPINQSMNGVMSRRSSYSALKLRLEYDLLPYLADQSLLYALDNSEPVQSDSASPLKFWCQIKTAGSPLLASQYYLDYYTKIYPTSESYFADDLSHQRKNQRRRDLHFEGLNLHGNAASQNGQALLTALENHVASRHSVTLSEHSPSNMDIMLEGNPMTLHDSTPLQPTIIGPVYIHPSAKIHSLARIGPYVTIGEYVSIGAGVSISNSLILPRTVIQVPLSVYLYI